MEQKDYSHIEPKAAATVLLARDSGEGIEVFMVKRHHKIDFASGALVFPGGKVDDADADPALRAYCTGAAELDDTALAIRIAAVRETFEECGVLLARARGAADLVDAARLKALEGWAVRLNDDTTTMAEFVESEELELALDELAYFAHWVTPPLIPKRFDAHFYLVNAPRDQVAVHDGSESVDSTWSRPQDVIAAADADEIRLVFATRMNLLKLGGFGDAAAAMTATRAATVVTVQPHMESFEDGIRTLRIPLEAGYGGDRFCVADKPAM